MRRTAKIVSVVLAVLMVLTLIPFAAFAADNEQGRVAGWKANYQLFLNTILDDSNYTSWNYVDQNGKNLNAALNAGTAFNLYDGAWAGYLSGDYTLTKDHAKGLLMELIEKAEYDFDDGYVDEIVKVLETAQDANDFIQKVNQYLDLDVFKSEGWGTTFQVIGTVVKVANVYQTYRDKFIKAYAEVLSVQMANAYFVELLQYIVDHPVNAVLSQAAAELIDDIESGMEEVFAAILEDAAIDGADAALTTLGTIAMNSNVYTAAALKIYGIAKKVVNVLWNATEQVTQIDQLLVAYDFQDLVSDWAAAAVAGNDDDKTLIAVNMTLTARTLSENALYSLLLAKNDGVVGKIKNKLYGTAFEEIEISLASIDAMRDAMFVKDVADFQKVERAIYAYCPVDVQILKADNSIVYTLKDGRVTNDSVDSGIYVSVYSEYAKDYLKIAYLYDAYKVRLSGTAEGTVTLIMDVLDAEGNVNDWSFTDRAVANGTKIVFETAFDGTPYYLASDTDAKTYFNDEFKPSEHKDVTAHDVADAVVSVGKQEAKGFAEIIKAFFQKLFESFANLFKFKK